MLPSPHQPIQQYDNISTHDRSVNFFGNVYNNGTFFPPQPDAEAIAKFGLCFGAAPQIDPSFFVGRASELNEISRILQPEIVEPKQRQLVLGGIGGIGKTQLAIAYAQRHQQSYDSIFWLNATSLPTLHLSLRSVAGRFIKADSLEILRDEQVLARVHEWLSHKDNTQWLLIFDNYDEPDQWDITKYFPYTAYGSIIITTRLPHHVPFSSDQIHVQSLSDIEESLDILEKRSRRENLRSDPYARRLAERLAGLPLALSTAGAFLSKRASTTFQQYLDIYEQRWNIDPRRPLQLQEYQNRTFYTTWDLSYNRLEDDDPDAAKVLQLFAYFDNQNIRYEHLKSGVENSPSWLQRLLSTQIDFENVMSTLVDYCFVSIQSTTQSYSIHNCIHDWTFGALNKMVDEQLFWYASNCIAANIDLDDWDNLDHLKYAHLTSHAVRLTHPRFSPDVLFQEIKVVQESATLRIFALLKAQFQLTAAELTCLRALTGYEKALGSDHTSTLDIVNNAGLLYKSQGKLEKAEPMCLRALAGYQKNLGPDHAKTLSVMNDLGDLYQDQSKLGKAEQMYLQVLAKREQTLGLNHVLTLNTVNSLGNIYNEQSKLDEAKQMYSRALAGYEKALGLDHPFTLNAFLNSGVLLEKRGKLHQAEQMYSQALVGYEKALGPNHTSTLHTMNNLGTLYLDQNELDKAEQMLERALAGYKKVLGLDHPLTLQGIVNLALLYAKQGKLDDAELMYLRAQDRYEKLLGPDHTMTLHSKHCLACLCSDQGQFDRAERIYEQLIVEYENVLGGDHLTVLMVIRNFGLLRQRQGRLEEAEHLYQKVLASYQRQLGAEHPKTRIVMDDLARLHGQQGQTDTRTASPQAT